MERRTVRISIPFSKTSVIVELSVSVRVAMLKYMNATCWGVISCREETIPDDVSILTNVHTVRSGPKELSKRSNQHIASVR